MILGVVSVNPDDISKEDMRKLADHIEKYIETLQEVMIIPEDLQKEYGERISHGIKLSKKLIQKLRKGDKSVFKEQEEWNSIL